jgi:SulP family sulfate permease
VLYILPAAPIIGTIPTGMPSPQLPHFSIEAIPGMVSAAMVLALLGAIDSLLTSLIADNVSRTQHKSDRELIGQGIGNFFAGMFGGIPGAGATMRTVVNIRAGGQTPISGALHALILLALMLGLAPLAEHIPHAVLAGILLKVGYDIIDWRYVRRLHRAPRAGVVIMLAVLLLTVLVDLVTAVGTGVVMASVLFVKRMHDLQVEGMEMVTSNDARKRLDKREAEILEASNDRILLYRLRGPASFGAARELSARFSNTMRHDVLVLDLTDVPMIDTSASLALEDVIVDAHAMGTKVFISGASDKVRDVLDRLDVVKLLGGDGVQQERFTTLKQAQAALE